MFGDPDVLVGEPVRLTVESELPQLDSESLATLGPLVAICPATLLLATIELDLTLRLEFTNGVVIEVPEDLSFEAWEINGPESRLIVCPPAGGPGPGLAVWL